MPTIAAMDLGDLTEGQSWSDIVSIPMERKQAHVILAALTRMGEQVRDGIAQCERQAERGDVIALLVGQALADTDTDLVEASLAIVQVVNPDLYAEVKAHAAAQADA